jgi:hypothetical protein
VPIDSGSGLGAEVAVPGVEIECTDAVFAADTLELYSPFDPIGGVVFHGLIVIVCSEGRTHHGGLSKVICGASSANTIRSLSVTFASAVTSENIICSPPEIARCAGA